MLSDGQKAVTHKQSRLKLLLTLITFAALVILVYSIRRQIGGVIDNLGRVNLLALLLILPLEFLNYDAYARLYKKLFAILGKNISYREMFKLTLELNFVNHILPSGGVSGISYFSVRMRSNGVSGAKSTLVQFMKLFLLFVSFQPILVLGLFFLAARGHVNNFIILIASSIITLLVVGTFIAVYIIESRERINTTLTNVTKALNAVLRFFRRGRRDTFNIQHAQGTFDELHDNYMVLKEHWRELKMPLLYMTIANLTEIMTVYVVYIAFGELVNVGAVILAYAIANFAGLISVLPAGIGVYEGLMTGVLAATGIAAKLSIPVTLMYRVLNMFIQLVPGYIFYQRAVRAGLGVKKNG
jgi:uncharacterized protein (TIRG00374 family)